MDFYKIPITGTQEEFPLTLDNQRFVARVTWNRFIPAWDLSLWTRDDRTPLMLSRPIVAGAVLNAGYHDLKLSGYLVVIGTGNKDGTIYETFSSDPHENWLAVADLERDGMVGAWVRGTDPTEDSLGVDHHLYYITVTQAELDEAKNV